MGTVRHHSKGWKGPRSAQTRGGPRNGGDGGDGGGRGGGSRNRFSKRGGERGGRPPYRRTLVGGDRPTGADSDSGGVPVNLSFGNFAFQALETVGQRGGGVRELSSLLRQARRRASSQRDQLRTRKGIEERNDYLLSTAMQRAAGKKIKDDPHKLNKALAKRRSKKKQSAKRWAKRLRQLEDSVENVVKDRSAARQTTRARKAAKQTAKEKRKSAVKGLRAGGRGGASAASGKRKKKAKKDSGGWSKSK